MLLCHSNRQTPTRGALRFGNYRSRLLSFLWPYSQPSFMLSFSSPPVIGLFRCRFSSGLCTTPCGITRHPSCHCVFSIFSLLTGIALCTSLGVCGRCRIRTCDGNRIFYFCLRPLSQPSLFCMSLCHSDNHLSILSSLILPSAIHCLISFSGYNHSLDATCRPFSSHSTRVRLNIWP